jgi:DNA invertase Pin-like site-specific DNA recombinase
MKYGYASLRIEWKLDRLGRSLLDVITMLDDLRAHRVKFHSLTEAIDTATPTGRAMWQAIGVWPRSNEASSQNVPAPA